MHEEMKNDGMPLLCCLKISVSQAVIFYIYNLNISQTHHLLYNISLGYMFRLFSVIIRPY